MSGSPVWNAPWANDPREAPDNALPRPERAAVPTAGDESGRAAAWRALCSERRITSASTSATRVPSPIRELTKPSSASCSKTAITVFLPTPNSLAAARVEGSRVPGSSRPDRMAARRLR